MNYSSRLLRGVALSVATSALVVPVSLALTAGPATAGPCSVSGTTIRAIQAGQPVFIPSNNVYGPFQRGGTQGYSQSDGAQKSKTKGSSDTVGGGGGFDIKLVSLSAKYDHQWNRSTTNTVTRSVTYSGQVPLPKKRLTRVRLYNSGWKFNYVVRVSYEGGTQCSYKDFSRTAVLPEAPGASKTAQLPESIKKVGRLKKRPV